MNSTKLELQSRRSLIHGTGLFTQSKIRKGDFIGRFEGQPTSRNGRHVLWYEEENGALSALKVENLFKYANHSRQPNTEVIGREMYAIRHIEPGEELTFDYGDDW